MKLGLMDKPVIPEILEPLLQAWREQKHAIHALTAVRSSALVEDRFGSSFAGQFESFIGIESDQDFLTAVRSCWAALWSTQALRHSGARFDPADTAMALLIQPSCRTRLGRWFEPDCRR
jgi:pyruvate,water dikinase